MSDFTNLFRTPDNPGTPEKQPGSQSGLTRPMLRYLIEASPWLRFVGIFSLGFCAIAVIGGIITSAVLFMFPDFLDDFDGVSAALAGLIYVPMGVLCFFPSWFIYKFGTKIRNYQFTNADEDLELAFKNNKSLWKFFGIFCIIFLALIPVFIALAVVGGFVAAVSGIFF
jgi:hypothetical protein